MNDWVTKQYCQLKDKTVIEKFAQIEARQVKITFNKPALIAVHLKDIDVFLNIPILWLYTGRQ